MIVTSAISIREQQWIIPLPQYDLGWDRPRNCSAACDAAFKSSRTVGCISVRWPLLHCGRSSTCVQRPQHTKATFVQHSTASALVLWCFRKRQSGLNTHITHSAQACYWGPCRRLHNERDLRHKTGSFLRRLRPKIFISVKASLGKTQLMGSHVLLFSQVCDCTFHNQKNRGSFSAPHLLLYQQAI